MRKIKFRVWDNVDYMSSPFTLDDLVMRRTLFTSDCKVMQFTGLKDKNGKEIYEGDIIKVTGDDEISELDSDTGIGDVESYNGLWYVNKINNSIYDLKESYDLEIIGNLYENPELLESNQ